MANSIGKLALQIEVDATQFAEGLVLSRKELQLHRQAMQAATSPAEEMAAAEKKLQELMAKNPQHADAYAKALQKMRAEVEATAQAERDAAKAKADAIEADKVREATRKAEIEQRRQDRAEELAAMRLDRAAEMAERKKMAEQAKAERAAEVAESRRLRAAEIADAKQDRATELATLRLDRANELAARKAEQEKADLGRRAQTVIARDQTGAERYAAELRNLNELRAKGAITADQHARAVAREAAELRVASVPAKNAFDGMLSSLTPTNLAIAGVATVTAAASAGVYGFTSNLRQAVERIDATADAAANLGVLPEQFDKLQKAAYLADAPIEAIGTLLDKVQTKASEAASGEQAAVDVFRQIGLSVADIRDQAPDKLFEVVADRIAQLKPSDQIRAMKDIFGRSAAEAGNLLRNYREFADQVERAGLASQPEKFAAIGQLDDSTKRLVLSWQDLYDRIAVDVAPALTGIVEELTGATDSTRGVVSEASTLRDVLYDVRDTVKATRDNWQEISGFVSAAANVAKLITSPQSVGLEAFRERSGANQQRAEQRAEDDARRRQEAAAEIEKQRQEVDAQAKMRRALIAAEKEVKIKGVQGPDELERMLQARRDEIALIERGKAAVEIDKAVRLGAQEEELAELAKLRAAEQKRTDREALEKAHREVVLSMLDKAIQAEERALKPQEKLNELIREQAALVNDDLLSAEAALANVRREAAAIKPETASSGAALIQSGSQAFVTALAKRDGQDAQMELQRRAVEELKKLVRKPAAEIVVMKAGA